LRIYNRSNIIFSLLRKCYRIPSFTLQYGRVCNGLYHGLRYMNNNTPFHYLDKKISISFVGIRFPMPFVTLTTSGKYTYLFLIRLSHILWIGIVVFQRAQSTYNKDNINMYRY